MTTPKFIVTFLTVIGMASCGKTIRLAEKDFKWIPYNGHETIVFYSNAGETDTIFLLGADRQSIPSDPLDVFPTNLDHFSIGMRHSDPSPPSGNHRYLESEFLELSVGEDKEPYLSIHFAAKDSRFYGGSFLDLIDLDTIKQVTLDTKTKRYTDIIILTPESNEYSDRSDFLTKLYWSKSEGLIRYDKQDSVYWELTRKYSP